MADATSTQCSTDPDRASFSIAWQTARDLVIQAAGVIAGTVVDLAGTIGRHVLAGLLPQRRLRVSPHIDRTSYKATTSIEMPGRSYRGARPARPPGRKASGRQPCPAGTQVLRHQLSKAG